MSRLKSLFFFSALLILAQFFSEALNPLLEYRTEAVMKGEVYRLLSFYFVHLTTAHWILNHVGLLMLVLWLGPFLNSRAWVIFGALVITGMSASLLWFFPAEGSVLGLSGVNYALASLLLLFYAQIRSRWYLLAWLLVGLQVFNEWLSDHSYSKTFFGFDIAYELHLTGYLMGLLCFVVLMFFRGTKAF